MPGYLSRYVDLFQSLSATLANSLTNTALALAILSVAWGLLSWRRGSNYRRLAILGTLSASLITALYALPPSSYFVIPCEILGATMAIAYAITWGFRDTSPSSSSRTCDLMAVGVIAVSTVIKLIDLEAWPLLLTDYAARTGVETISPSPKVHPGWWGIGQHAYLHGGGSSLLHSPLLSLLFSFFGYTTFAVRFAEVLGSVATLAFTWLILRMMSAAPWNLVGLTLLALSAEHISQARMGTFYSISQALGLCVLWLWLGLQQARQQPRPWVLGLVVATVLLPAGYAPIRAVFVFTAAMILITLAQRCRERLIAICICIMIVFSTGFAYITLRRDSPFGGFGGPRWVLATDSPVWFKNSKNIVTTDIQPFGVILQNTAQNFISLISDCFAPQMNMELPYAWALVVLVSLACVGIFSKRWRTISLYTIIGILPAVLTYPILRRSMLVRPLVPLVLALFFQEYVSALLTAVKPKIIRTIAVAGACVMVVLLPTQGLYVVAKNNGSVGTGPSFGPEYAADLIQHLKKLAGHTSLAVLSPSFGIYKYKMALADHLYRPDHGGFEITFPEVTPQTDPSSLLKSPMPLCLAILNESERAWIAPWLQNQLPHLNLKTYEKRGQIMYWMACTADHPA